jgi:hypothetical protein
MVVVVATVIGESCSSGSTGLGIRLPAWQMVRVSTDAALTLSIGVLARCGNDEVGLARTGYALPTIAPIDDISTQMP